MIGASSARLGCGRNIGRRSDLFCVVSPRSYGYTDVRRSTSDSHVPLDSCWALGARATYTNAELDEGSCTSFVHTST